MPFELLLLLQELYWTYPALLWLIGEVDLLCISFSYVLTAPSVVLRTQISLLPSARMRSEGTVVGLSVCLSGLYLAGRAFIRSTNDATYLAGNEVENICVILSETSPLQSWSPTGIVQLISAAAIFRYAHAVRY